MRVVRKLLVQLSQTRSVFLTQQDCAWRLCCDSWSLFGILSRFWVDASLELPGYLRRQWCRKCRQIRHLPVKGKVIASETKLWIYQRVVALQKTEDSEGRLPRKGWSACYRPGNAIMTWFLASHVMSFQNVTTYSIKPFSFANSMNLFSSLWTCLSLLSISKFLSS